MSKDEEELHLPSSGEDEQGTETTEELLEGDTMSGEHETRAWTMKQLEDHFGGLIERVPLELAKVDAADETQRKQIIEVGNFARKANGIVHDLARDGVTHIENLPKDDFAKSDFLRALSEYKIPEDKTDRTLNPIFKAEARARILAIAKQAEEQLARDNQRKLEREALGNIGTAERSSIGARPR